MTTFFLELRAPFAAFRWLQAGVYRATSPVIPPSTAYGLVTNLAGIDIRGDLNRPITPIRADAPVLRVAVGRIGEPSDIATLYQQLHSYPVGTSGRGTLDKRAFGSKYWIAPVRREYLAGVHMVIGVEAPARLREAVTLGLSGSGERAYGLPFLGDNNLLIDRIDVRDTAPSDVSWYERWDGRGARPGSCRLTVRIDRADSSRTETPLFAPVVAPAPPEGAWQTVGPL